ncbi:carbohydrate kinase family protein, partial [Candidatus Calescamantes bacterium]|nr:carbohydrate kinase family protein [Candidatus Calescamantes bacterium]
MENSKFDLIVVGHLLKEKIIFPDGRKMGPVLGSPAAYISVGAAKLGLKVGLVTNIGKDMPEEILKVFKEVGVDTQGMKIGDNTTTNLLIYKKSGEKKLEFLKKADDISFDDIPENYLDAGFFLICPINYEIDRELIVKLYQKGKRLSMELSGFGGASSVERENKVQFLKNITKFFEIVKGGEEDYKHLFGKMDIRFIEKFIEWGAKVSILTRGEKETLIAVKNCSQIKYFRIPSLPTKVVDTTGA